MEGSEVLALKWNNHQRIFYQIICGLRSKETYTDATLACEGKFFPVHKLVLSTCSEYFSDIFERTPCKNPVVVLKDIKCTDLTFLLDYMYIGEVNVRQSELSSLIKAAECLRVKGLAVPDEETPPKCSSKNSSSRQQQQQQQPENHSPPVKRRRTEDRRSFARDNSPEQPAFKRSSGGSSNANHNLESKSCVALRHEEVNIQEQRISRNKDNVPNQSETLNPVIKLEQDDSFDTLQNHQDVYEDPQYLAAGDDSCGDISPMGSRADKEKVEFIEDDLDPNFSDILNEETLATVFPPPPGGNMEPWDGGHVLSSHGEIPTATSNPSHNSRQQQQKDLNVGSSINGELMCPICGRCSSRRDNLDRHIRSHLGDKPFKCPFCPFRAQLKYNMKTHVERRHPQQLMLNPNMTFGETTEIH